MIDVESKGYITSIPQEYITESELNQKGYITSIPKEYITETELESKGYITEHQSLEEYYTKTEVDSKFGDIDTLLTEILGLFEYNC